MWLIGVGCEDEEEIIATAVELCLPWRRNTGREPVSSVETHMVADGSNPVRADGGNWMKGLTHSLSDSQSDSHSRDEYDPLDVAVDEGSTDQTTPLCSPNNAAVVVNQTTPLCSPNDAAVVVNCARRISLDAKPAEVKVDDLCDGRLPPYRKTSGHSETPMQLQVPHSVVRFTPRCRPTRCGSFPSSMDAACRAVDQEDKAEVAASRLPWRYASNERAVPDQHAPRRAVVSCFDTVTKESPAQSFVDAVSTYPQPSCHSFRLSEAESRHSEPVHVQHFIDIMSAGHRITSTASDSDDDESTDILCNLEQLNSHDRICMWLDALSESNNELPSGIDAMLSDEVS